MTKKTAASTYSWILSVIIHAILIAVVLRTTYPYLMPEGNVSSESVAVEIVSKGNQMEVFHEQKNDSEEMPTKKSGTITRHSPKKVAKQPAHHLPAKPMVTQEDEIAPLE